MKKCSELVGLPIISITDGVEVGKVRGAVINPDNGSVDYVIADCGVRVLGMPVLPSEKIVGVGEYAMTIDLGSDIAEITEIPDALDLLKKEFTTIGKKVLTRKGTLIGVAGDIYVDEDKQLAVAGVEYTPSAAAKVVIIPRDHIVTFGKSFVMVTEEAQSAAISAEELDGSAAEKKNSLS